MSGATFRQAAMRLLFLVSIIASSPAAAQLDGRPMLLPVDDASLVVATADGQRSFTVEIADDMEERAAGLMFRERMEVDRGMLFVFEETRPVSFWMRNTPMPLDLIFIGEDGIILDILPGEPFSEAPITPRGPVRFVLEVKQGVAAAAGVKVGDRVRHPSVDAVGGG